jgi:hypothetical protein
MQADFGNVLDQGLYPTQRPARNSVEKQEGGIMKNEMPSQLLDEKYAS